MAAYNKLSVIVNPGKREKWAGGIYLGAEAGYNGPTPEA
jgi:hypothetical protein